MSEEKPENCIQKYLKTFLESASVSVFFVLFLDYYYYFLDYCL